MMVSQERQRSFSVVSQTKAVGVEDQLTLHAHCESEVGHGVDEARNSSRSPEESLCASAGPRRAWTECEGGARNASGLVGQSKKCRCGHP